MVVARPLFAIGISMFMMPIILGNEHIKPLATLMCHQQWLPFSRLVYGVFLSNVMIIKFRMYNAANGTLLSLYDMLLFWFSFLALSFTFSFFLYVIVEGPIANMVDAFVKLPFNKQKTVSSKDRM